MKTINYIVILNYADASILKIKLTPGQKKKLERVGDIEEYLSIIEDKYKFNTSNCQWMTCNKIEEKKIEL